MFNIKTQYFFVYYFCTRMVHNTLQYTAEYKNPHWSYRTMKESAENTHFTKISLDMNKLVQQIIKKNRYKSEG